MCEAVRVVGRTGGGRTRSPPPGRTDVGQVPCGSRGRGAPRCPTQCCCHASERAHTHVATLSHTSAHTHQRSHTQALQRFLMQALQRLCMRVAVLLPCVCLCVPRALIMGAATACVCVCVCVYACVCGLSYTHLEQLAWVQRRLATLMLMCVPSLCCKQYLAAPPAGPYDALLM